MAEQVMSLNTDVVGTAVNQISVLTADIQTRNKKFVELLNSKNESTQGKFALLKQLQVRVQEEAANFDKILEAQEEIKAALQRYTELAEEVNDDSAFV